MDISEKAKIYLHQHLDELILKFANIQEFPSSKRPMTFFMAGSPGAGKTEISIGFNQNLVTINKNFKCVRIDADEIKEFIPFYDGKNSDEVKLAAIIGLQKLFDYSLKHQQNIILDGTFSSYKHSREDVIRSLKRNRDVDIFYLHQDPLVAWEFTKGREKKQGRTIPKKIFIDSYFQAKENVNRIKKEFNKQVAIHLIIKNFKNDTEDSRLYIDEIDNFLKLKYTKKQLESLI